ncbi:FG-GAP-like repeat-containing protein [Streptomyces sp. NPDC001941]|uniref:FG-GAP-like repeat-containing protein n=1 Tax=Streptomyces sp. NPDC001941 TaxID=3154659 RepID=UPI003326D653
MRDDGATGTARARTAAAAPEGTGAARVKAEDDAKSRAEKSGKRVKVEGATTETSELYANPSGTFTLEETLGAPRRVKRGDAWVDVDPTLRKGANGRWQPAASAMESSFSPGGSGAALTVPTRDGKTLSYDWPTALPAPRVSGAAALYQDVLPGVDLRLTATAAGVEQDLVIKTREAGTNPQLQDLRLKVRGTSGLDVRSDAAGSLTAAPQGRSAQDVGLVAPAPLLSDSTGGRADQSAPEGPDRSRTALGSAEIDGDTLTLRAGEELLAADDTAYPVVMSQNWVQGNRTNWTRVYKNYPTTSYWNKTDPARVGYESDTGGLSRSLFTLDAKNLKGVKVINSTFRTYETWSWSCSARPVELWNTTAISSATTWNKQPTWSEKIASKNVAKGYSSSDCPAGGVEFDTTKLAQKASDKAWPTITLALRAANESDTYGWKKFKNDPVIVTEYDRAPDKPTDVRSDPAIACGRTEPFPKIGKLFAEKGLGLQAKVTDPDGGDVTARFTFKHHNGANVATPEATVKSGSIAKVKINANQLKDGDTYSWNVQARDPYGLTSASTEWCSFGVDFTRPDKPPAVSSAEYPENTEGAAARTPGTFTFTANGVADVETFQYSLNHDFTTGSKPTTVKADKLGGSAKAKLTPFKWGTNTLYVRSADGAGNLSDTYKYVFKVAPSHADPEGDLNGDGHTDVLTVDGGHLRVHSGDGKGNFTAIKDLGSGWTGSKLSHRGDWTGDGYEDLLAHLPSSAQTLWLYAGTGMGNFQPRVPLPRPEGSPSADWSKVTSFVSAGDVNWDSYPDLLTIEDGSLYLYAGTGDGVAAPVKIGDGGWEKRELLAPGDADGDGLADLWYRDRDSGDLFQILNDPDAEELGTTLGDTSRAVKIGSGLTAAAYPQMGTEGDLTGDEHGDLWFKVGTGAPSVVKGQADPTAGTVFRPPYPKPDMANAAQWKNARLTASGDFTGDGKQDLLTVWADGKVTVNPGTDGGWFATEIQTLAASTLWRDHAKVITAGDFTGDGKADLVVRWSDGELSLYPGTGDGKLGTDVMLAKPGDAWKNVQAMAAGDFTGDKKTDLVAAHTTGVLSLFPGNGNGGLGAEKQMAASGSVWQHDVLLTAGDFNSDGKTDLIARWVDGEVSFHPGNGNGTLATDTTLIKPNEEWKKSRAIAAGRFSGTGSTDLVSVWESGRVALQTGDGKGGIGALVNLVAP